MYCYWGGYSINEVWTSFYALVAHNAPRHARTLLSQTLYALYKPLAPLRRRRRVAVGRRRRVAAANARATYNLQAQAIRLVFSLALSFDHLGSPCSCGDV